MKPILLILTLLSVSCRSMAQFEDTYQPDSVYKQHNIKSRVLMYDYNRYHTNYISNYDHEGRLREIVRYDTSGVKTSSKEIRYYDSAGNISKEYQCSYYHWDTALKKLNALITPDTSTRHFAYDSLGRLKRWRTDKNGQTMFTELFRYDGRNTSIEYLNFHDSIYYQTSSRYDEKHALIHSSFRSFRNGEVSASGEYAYKNSYDKSGRLKNTLVINDNSLGDVEAGSVVTASYSYSYSNSGLLIKKTTISYLHEDAYQNAIIFDYRFW